MTTLMTYFPSNKYDVEIWVPIKGYEKEYEISNKGRVRSLRRWIFPLGRKRKIVRERILKARIGSHGYYVVGLRGYDKKLIHRLVGEAFISNPNNYNVINHKDGNKLNNSVLNLEWCTNLHNIRHAHLNKLLHGQAIKIKTDEEEFIFHSKASIRRHMRFSERKLEKLLNDKNSGVSKVSNDEYLKFFNKNKYNKNNNKVISIIREKFNSN